MYNNSWILCEINNMGVSVASDIFNDFEYENIFKVGKNNNTGSQEIAFQYGTEEEPSCIPQQQESQA
ncbi:hypothetical protein [Mangrovicoccus ximenensis]|uniref:hypothetical protein n=1 Tax=Mangrovicoccus ximenensis TaxID=1911570 RepID=UPI0011AE2196|nr:hypothetical protein [Mangrovicoccus ximenensis]